MSEEVIKKRGRPPGSKNKRKQPSKFIPKTLRETKPKKVCACCGVSKTIASYYKSRSDMHNDNLSPYCKDCVAKKSLDEHGHFSVDNFKTMLRLLDKPFIPKLLDGIVGEFERIKIDENADDTMIVTRYFRSINLPEYMNLNWDTGAQYAKIKAAGTDKTAPSVAEVERPIKLAEEDEPVYLDEYFDDDFELTRDIVDRFGQGYTKREYRAMVKKYDFLLQSYVDSTALHTEALVNYVRFKVKEELATADGRVDEAERWATLATKAADKAKINPSQLSQSDLQGGLNSFSELLMAVEQAVDVVPILPQFKYRPNDAVDFTIWAYVNYCRKLEGKPLCAYEDVYEFYDRRKEEYIAQYGDMGGIFKLDPTEKNRETVKRFITLPKDYDAATADDGGDDDG